MDFMQLKDYLLAKPETVEVNTAGVDSITFKVRHKVFAVLVNEEGIARISLKCDPDKALELRDMFEAVMPGINMNKRHWNTVVVDGSVSESELIEMMNHSYEIVVKGLTTPEREDLESRYSLDELYP